MENKSLISNKNEIFSKLTKSEILPLGKEIREGINMRKRSVVSISDNELELDSSIKKRTFSESNILNIANYDTYV